MKLVILGANGQVGYELQRSLLPLGEVIALDRAQADLTQLEKLKQTLIDLKPDVIVNAAAYTVVDKAEEEPELAMLINGEAPGVIAEAAKQLDALLIHYSTDYVFNGAKTEPYTEEDTPNPINVYGRTKLAGEQAIKNIGGNYLILRTSWVYSKHGNNFLKTILRLSKEREELSIVADQFGVPNWARNVADATSHVIVKIQHKRNNNNFTSALYHFSARGKTTWYGFASAIIERTKLIDTIGNLKIEKVLPITTDEYPLPAPRPKYSQLDSSLISTRFGVRLPEWHDVMELCIDEFIELQ
jgi:dTDP-4-dehydrorhamnose reductase